MSFFAIEGEPDLARSADHALTGRNLARRVELLLDKAGLLCQ